jgi:probable F420-dependent oxidoreductase
LTMLAAVASVTRRVRLATGILIAPLRPAALLAKQVATLDQLSGGRVDLGVGTGWQREEYDAVGASFEARGRLLTDTLGALHTLWRDTPADFSSPTITFQDVYCEPKPVQPGGVPLWIAGTLHERNLDRVVRYGSGWIPIMGASTDDIAAGAKLIRDAIGKDIDVQAPIRIVPGDIARSIESVPALVAAGATDIQVTLRAFAREPADAPPVLAELVRRFRDAV